MALLKTGEQVFPDNRAAGFIFYHPLTGYVQKAISCCSALCVKVFSQQFVM